MKRLLLFIAFGFGWNAVYAEPAEPAGAEPPPALSPQELFRLGRISRELGDYKLSTDYYTSYLATKPEKKITSKVTEELLSCQRLADGWQLPVKSKEDLLIMQMRSTLRLLPPDEAEPKLNALITQCPGRWEAFALRAQNRFRQARFSDALKNLDTAYAKGGMQATLATAALAEESRKHQETLNVAKMAQGHLANKRTTAAAELLETSWKSDPSRVEFGLKAAQLRVAKREFKVAGSICKSITDYLKQHPEHPQAPNAVLIQIVAENCEKGAAVRGNAPGAKVARTRGVLPPKTKSGTSVKTSKPKGDMTSRFLRKK